MSYNVLLDLQDADSKLPRNAGYFFPPNTLSYPTRRLSSTHRRENEYLIWLPSAMVTWQILCRFLDLILASHVILTPKLDKSRAPTISHIIFSFILAFLKTSSQEQTELPFGSIQGTHTHLCLAVISNKARARVCTGNISTPMPKVVQSTDKYTALRLPDGDTLAQIIIWHALSYISNMWLLRILICAANMPSKWTYSTYLILVRSSSLGLSFQREDDELVILQLSGLYNIESNSCLYYSKFRMCGEGLQFTNL